MTICLWTIAPRIIPAENSWSIGNCPLDNSPGQVSTTTIVLPLYKYTRTITAQSNDNYKLRLFHGYFLLRQQQQQQQQ